jgi:hypothetical protein
MVKITILSRYDIYIFSILLAIGAAYALAKPTFNWDMLGYIGVVNSYETDSIVKAHSETYEAVSEVVPADKYKELLGHGSSNYRNTIYKNAEAFSQVLPFYSSKKLYVLIVFLLTKIGANYVYATIIPSVISYVALGYIIFGWIRKYFLMPYNLIFAGALLFSPPLLQIAKLSTPDALSALIILLSFYIYIEKGKYFISLLVLILSITVRPDNIIICVLMIALTCYKYKFSKEKVIAFGSLAAIAICLFYIMGITSGNLSYKALFVHSFTDQPRDLIVSQYVLDLTFKEYVYIYLKAFGKLSLHSAIPISIFLASSYWVIWASLGYNNKFRYLTEIIVVVFICFIARYALFPNLFDRFYVPYLVITAVCLLKILSAMISFAQEKMVK